MLLPDLMLAFASRTVHYRDMVGFGPGTETTTESPRHAHQMVIVQILIGTIQFPPPHAKTATGLSHGEVGIRNHPIDAIIPTFQKLTVQSAQLIRHDLCSVPAIPPSTQTGRSSSWRIFATWRLGERFITGSQWVRMPELNRSWRRPFACI